MLIQLNGRATLATTPVTAAFMVTGSESTAIKFAAATSKRLQAQYDTTKTLNTGVVLQQVTQTVPSSLVEPVCIALPR